MKELLSLWFIGVILLLLTPGLWILYTISSVIKIIILRKSGALTAKRIRTGIILMLGLSGALFSPVLALREFYPYITSEHGLILLALPVLIGLFLILRRYVGLVLLAPSTLLYSWACYDTFYREIKNKAGIPDEMGSLRYPSNVFLDLQLVFLDLVLMVIILAAIGIDPLIGFLRRPRQPKMEEQNT